MVHTYMSIQGTGPSVLRLKKNNTLVITVCNEQSYLNVFDAFSNISHLAQQTASNVTTIIAPRNQRLIVASRRLREVDWAASDEKDSPVPLTVFLIASLDLKRV